MNLSMFRWCLPRHTRHKFYPIPKRLKMVYKLWSSCKNNREYSKNIRRRNISLCKKKGLLQKTMDEISEETKMVLKTCLLKRLQFLLPPTSVKRKLAMHMHSECVVEAFIDFVVMFEKILQLTKCAHFSLKLRML